MSLSQRRMVRVQLDFSQNRRFQLLVALEEKCVRFGGFVLLFGPTLTHPPCAVAKKKVTKIVNIFTRHFDEHRISLSCHRLINKYLLVAAAHTRNQHFNLQTASSVLSSFNAEGKFAGVKKKKK